MQNLLHGPIPGEQGLAVAWILYNSPGLTGDPSVPYLPLEAWDRDFPEASGTSQAWAAGQPAGKGLNTTTHVLQVPVLQAHSGVL